MADRDGREADDHRDDDVAEGGGPLAVPEQKEGLEAERRERGVAAAEADHHEDACLAPDEETTVGPGQRGKEADDEGAERVDEDRAPRESVSEPGGPEKRKGVARHAAESAAERDRKIGQHRSVIPLPSADDLMLRTLRPSSAPPRHVVLAAGVRRWNESAWRQSQDGTRSCASTSGARAGATRMGVRRARRAKALRARAAVLLATIIVVHAVGIAGGVTMSRPH